MPFDLLGQHLGDAAHLGVPMGAVDVQELAHALHLVEPVAQAAVVNIRLRLGVGEGHAALLARWRGRAKAPAGRAI